MHHLMTQLLPHLFAAPATVKVIPGEGHEVGPSFFERLEPVDFVLSMK